MADDEKVLCVKNDDFSKFINSRYDLMGVKAPVFIPASIIPLRVLSFYVNDNNPILFIPRKTGDPNILQCEGNPTYRQLCSYTVINHLGLLASYTRSKQGGEGRLFGKQSIGVGGHITDEDFPEGVVSEETIEAGISRELFEEFPISRDTTIHYKGILYFQEHSDPVQLDHIGIVHEARTPPGSSIGAESPDLSIAEIKKTGLSHFKSDIGPGTKVLEAWSEELVKNVLQEPQYTFFRY